MAKKALKPDSLSEMLQTASHLIKFPTKRFYVDYDEEERSYILLFKVYPRLSFSGNMLII